jgi:hypothetical protein
MLDEGEVMAEAVRFELTKGVNPRQFSRLLPSTTRPHFRRCTLNFVQRAGF